MSMRKLQRFVTICSSALLFQPAAAQHLHFERCAKLIRGLSSVDCSDTNFYCPKGNHTGQERPLLSLRGCHNLCGSGFELSPIDDIFGQFFLWILPVIILAGHFHFPPLGWRNTLAVSSSIFGNPIGSLYAMLTRHEMFRRYQRRAVAAGFPESHIVDSAEAIAVVAAACDEFGWHDPLDFILKRLENRLPSPAVSVPDVPGTDGARAKPEEWSRSPETAMAPMPQQSDSGHKHSEPAVGGNGRDSEPVNNNTVQQESSEDATAGKFAKPANIAQASIGHAKTNPGSLLDPLETLYFDEARHELVSHRSDTQLGTWFAIAGFIGALAAAFIRVWVNRDRPWSPRTTYFVILFFHLISSAQISGHIGAFTSAFGPLVVLQDLQRKLQSQDLATGRKEEKSLVFSITLNPIKVWDRLQRQPEEQYSYLRRRTPTSGLEKQDQNSPQLLRSEGSSALVLSETWPSVAGYLGMNPTWRPHKHMSSSGKRDRSSRCLLGFAFGFVSTSWLAALMGSYFSVGHEGFGWYALTLTLIYLTWLVSFCFDYLLKSSRFCNVTSYGRLWRYTVIKDTVASLLIAGAIAIAHVGMLSTCLCATGAIFLPESQQRINLLRPAPVGYTRIWLQAILSSFSGLALICLLLCLVQYDARTARTVLCPSREGRHRMQLQLQRHRTILEEKGLLGKGQAN